MDAALKIQTQTNRFLLESQQFTRLLLLHDLASDGIHRPQLERVPEGQQADHDQYGGNENAPFLS